MSMFQSRASFASIPRRMRLASRLRSQTESQPQGLQFTSLRVSRAVASLASKQAQRHQRLSETAPSTSTSTFTQTFTLATASPLHLLTCKRTKVFVSKHNQSLHITPNQIVDYCNNHGIQSSDLRVSNSHVQIRECPFCPKPTNGKADNMFKIYVQIGGGAFFCHRCGSKGSWYDFKMKVGGYEVLDSMGQSSFPHASNASGGGNGNWNGNKARNSSHGGRNGNARDNSSGSGRSHQNQVGSYNNNNNNNNPYNSNVNYSSNQNQPLTQALPMPSPRLQAAYITNLIDAPPSQRKGESSPSSDALEYLTTTRGLTKQTLRKYGVGLGSYNFPSNEPGKSHKYVRANCITFPWIMRAGEIEEQEVLRGGSYHWEKEESKSGSKSKMDAKKSPTELSTADPDANEIGESNNEDDDESRVEEVNPLGPYVTRRIKARALEHKAWQRLDPPGGGWGLFGWHTVPPDATDIVLTEGEYDAMAVHQATGRPAVSLPNGCRSLPMEVLPMLERFDTIYLWMDNDGPGREGAEQFAKKIGVNRCMIVQPDSSVEGKTAPKDANEALLQGMNLEDIIGGSNVLPHERILTFSELRKEVLHEMLNPERYAGVPVPSLPAFTDIIKGFRRGEMTVLTGPTGSGKTTFLGQMSLDFAENGVNTLWGSFEIKNTRLMHKLLQQYSRGPLPEDKLQKAQALEVVADRFENLPLYFMKFHGGSDIDDVLDAMEYAAYVHDVEHIILDNMQFMITRNSSKYNSSFDKYDIQDIAIEKFRKFATSKNVHVTLVVHPRKEEEGMKLGMSSVYGSAKATQEADNVLILQKDTTNQNRKFIEIKKNRYDGTLGICPLHFQFDSKRYSENPEAQVSVSQKVAPRKAVAAPRLVPMNGGRSFVSAASSSPKRSGTGDSKSTMKSTFDSILQD